MCHWLTSWQNIHVDSNNAARFSMVRARCRSCELPQEANRLIQPSCLPVRRQGQFVTSAEYRAHHTMTGCNAKRGA